MSYEPGFNKGDIIEYADEHYEVVENRGDRGAVREYWNGKYGDFINTFYWEAYGERCKLVEKK